MVRKSLLTQNYLASTNYYFVFSDILVPEVVNYGLADCIGNGFRVSWVPDVNQGEVSVVGTQGCILNPVQLWWRHGGWTTSISLSRFTLHLPFPTLFPARLASLGCINSSLSSGFCLGLANGKLWWIFPFPDLPFRDLCSFSVDRLLQCWLPHHLRYSFFFGLRMPVTSGWPLVDPLEIVDCLLDYMSDHTVAEFAF